MTPDFFADGLKKRLHPDLYAREISPAGTFDFLLVRPGSDRSSGVLGYSATPDKSGNLDVSTPGGRYVFAFRRLGSDPVTGQIKAARREARRMARTMWPFRQGGLYLLLCGAEERWRPATGHTKADRTGLHNIILQAVHFVDPETRGTHLNLASWGPVRFGGANHVSKVVQEVLTNDVQEVR